ncbi:MAG: class II aldolase [Rhodospirillaceae bacterium]|nr:class II aldolase [Rhodospirillaceae bacterium]
MALANSPLPMSDLEWSTRIDLAAAYQLTDLYGWTDLAGTHISARIPGTNEFLLNPFGLFFEEITASSLIKVDCEGNLLSESDYPINPAGFIIHSALHMGSPTAHCVMHTHTRSGNAVAMQADGLLPLTQKALILEPFLRYHDYEGIALNEGERERLVTDMGQDGRVMILRNHGLLTIGESVAEAFTWMYRIENACSYQVDGLGGGQKLHYPNEKVQEQTRQQGWNVLGPNGFSRAGFEWPALIRKLERERGTSYKS